MRSVEADGALEREDGLGESWTRQKRLSSDLAAAAAAAAYTFSHHG